jgi:hypothetical protein
VLRLARFRDTDAASRTATRLTPGALEQYVNDRMVMPPSPIVPPLPMPEEVELTLEYGKGIAPTRDGASSLHALPVSLVLLKAGSLVALIESIGLSPERQQRLVADVVRAAKQLPPRGC